ncbi:MAG: aldo/keto reductase [Acidimicrobiia bacterium]|nr:aldo/keto reductase [Acidimicrobiia bacterium]
MQFQVMGTTGVTVSRYCLGAMMFGAMGNTDHAECIRIIDRALEAGINFIDTADAYSQGESELIVGKAISGRRDDVVVATKMYHPMGDGPNQRGNSRRWMRQAAEGSLRRLGTDRIDLYQLHRFDETVDLTDVVGGLTDLTTEGSIIYAGHSSWPAERMVEAQWTAERLGGARFRCEQASYSILKRRIERSVLPTAARYGLGVITYSPLGGSWLSGRYRDLNDIPAESRLAMMGRRWGVEVDSPENRARMEAVVVLQGLADEAGLPLPHLATAWALEHPDVTSVIIGPRTMEQLDDLLACANLRLDRDLLDRIDRLFAPGDDVIEDDRSIPNRALSRSARRRAESTR